MQDECRCEREEKKTVNFFKESTNLNSYLLLYVSNKLDCTEISLNIWRLFEAAEEFTVFFT